MGFKATEQVSELTYDFNPHLDLSGSIPEPTADQVETFRRAIYGALKEVAPLLGLGKDAPLGEQLQHMDAMLSSSADFEHTVIQAVSNLSGIPAPSLEGLPYRVRGAFCGWVLGIFLAPEA